METSLLKQKTNQLIIIIIVAILLISLGIYIGYFQNNRRIISKAIDNITSKIEDKFLMDYDDFNLDDSYTFTSDFDINIESDYLKQLGTYSPDYLSYYQLITNLSKTKNKIEFQQDNKKQKLFMDFQSDYNQEELIHIKYLIENNTEYYYIKGFLDNYINNGNSNYFEALQSNTTSAENMEYIYDFSIDSFKKNLKKEYFTKTGEKVSINGKEKTLQKVTLEIDNNRLVEIAKAILQELKDDEKANKILTGIDKDFKNAKIKSNEKILETDQKIKFSVYVDNITYQLKKYQLDFIDNQDMTTLTYEENENGVLNFYQNDKLMGNCMITYHEDNTVIKMNDKDNQSIGTIKIANKDNTYHISMDISKDDVGINLELGQKISNIKKNKSYDIKVTLIGTITSNQQNLASIKLNADGNVTKGTKIEENTDNATFASEVDSTKDLKIQQIITNMMAKLMS